MTHGLHVFDAPRDTDHARWPCSRTRDSGDDIIPDIEPTPSPQFGSPRRVNNSV